MKLRYILLVIIGILFSNMVFANVLTNTRIEQGCVITTVEVIKSGFENNSLEVQKNVQYLTTCELRGACGFRCDVSKIETFRPPQITNISQEKLYEDNLTQISQNERTSRNFFDLFQLFLRNLFT